MPESAERSTFSPLHHMKIKSVIRRDDSVMRHGGHGDNWHMSWAADDRQYVSQCDGFGWSQPAKAMANSRMIAVSGGPQEAKFHQLPGYPWFAPGFDVPRYYNFGTLALDGYRYQFLSTWNGPVPYPMNFGALKPNELRFIGAKLIYSSDDGRTWRNQDGSTPVVWEGWEHRSRETMVFFEEDQEAFSLLTVLQMGKNYEHNRDGYLYVFAPNGNTEGTMNELVLFRVPKAMLLDRTSYEYFAGTQSSGTPRWSRDITARKAIHTFPRGGVNALVHPFAWHPSVAYNAALGVYMMASWATGVGSGGVWFDRPSYLGFWIAPNPWGPWEQIHEETAWTPAGDGGARAFAPQIAPKWIAPDGKSFWIVWSDYQAIDPTDGYFTEELKAQYHRMDLSDAEWAELSVKMRQNRPFYAFNTQRVDLSVS